MAARARPHSDRCWSRTAELLVAWRRAPLPCRSRRDSGVFRPGRSSAGAGADADSGEGRGRCDVRAGRRHRRPTRRVPALGRRREARPCAALSAGLPRSPHERRRRPWRGHRGRHRARGRDNHGARPRPALRSVEGLLGGRGIAGIDPEDASLGSAAWAEWMSMATRPRDRRARNPGRLEDRHGAAAQVGAVRTAEGFGDSAEVFRSTRAWSSGPTSSRRTCRSADRSRWKAPRPVCRPIAQRPPSC